MIKQEKIIEVRERASIVEVISDYVTLKKTGRNYLGLCPFHAEKTPSFTVSEEKGIFHCFGCQTGGSVFQFLMHYDKLTFPEAVERIAKRYAITIERAEGSRASEEAGERESLYRLNEQVAAHFHKILFGSGEGEKALGYLKSRGVDEATARRFMLGYAPQTGSGLSDMLRKEKGAVNNALRLGLVGQRSGQDLYEKFFARLMFPIINAGGKIVGFGGRVLNQGLPKYLNSSETPLFHKSSTLYGLYQAKEGIRKADRIVVVEGYLDAIALFQYGIPYGVATLGTALTVDHVRILARYSKNIIALFDGDEAGRKAAARSFEIFTEAGLMGRAAFLPKDEDPDTFIRSRGKTALEAILEKAIPLADYYYSWLEQKFGNSLEGKSQIAEEIARVLSRVKSPFEVDLLVRRAVDTLGVREELLRQRLPLPLTKPAAKLAVGDLPRIAASPRDDVAERALIALMLRFPTVTAAVVKEDEVLQWTSLKWQAVVNLILGEWKERGNVEVSRVAQNLPTELSAQITALALEGETFPEGDCLRMADDCLSHLRRKHLRGLEKNLRVAIRAAEEEKDEIAKRERILEWQDVVRKKRQLERRKLEPKTTIR